GMIALEHREFALADVLEHVRNLTGERAAAKGLALTFDVGADVPERLVGDELRLAQILLNFASNAVKFTERGGVHVTVRMCGEGPDDVVLELRVKDTGVCLTPEARALLFRSFQQA